MLSTRCFRPDAFDPRAFHYMRQAHRRGEVEELDRVVDAIRPLFLELGERDGSFSRRAEESRAPRLAVRSIHEPTLSPLYVSSSSTTASRGVVVDRS